MAATANDVKYRIGDLYDFMDSSTRDAAITAFLASAQAYVDAYSGSATGVLSDSAVADLAALYVVTAMSGGSAAGEAFSLGNDTRVGNRNMVLMAAELKGRFMQNLNRLGEDVYYEVEEHE